MWMHSFASDAWADMPRALRQMLDRRLESEPFAVAPVSRRNFLKVSGGAGFALGAFPLLAGLLLAALLLGLVLTTVEWCLYQRRVIS